MLLLFKQNTIFSKFILETPAIIKRGECYQNKLPELTRHTYIFRAAGVVSQLPGCVREWEEILSDGLPQARFL